MCSLAHENTRAATVTLDRLSALPKERLDGAATRMLRTCRYLSRDLCCTPAVL